MVQWLLIRNKIKAGSWLWPSRLNPIWSGHGFSCPVGITSSHTLCSSSLFTKAVARTAPSVGSDLSPIDWTTCAPNKPLCDLSIYRLLEEICHEKWAALQAFISLCFPLCMYPYMKITYMVCTGLCCDSHISVWALEGACAFPLKVFSLVYKILPATM